MNKYKLQPGGVLDRESGANIPDDPNNGHWQQYQSWLAKGNRPDLWKTEEELLGEVRSDALRAIDNRAEMERQKIITPGAGQAMTYMRKETEARSFLSNNDPDPSSYPILAASIAAELGLSKAQVTVDHLQMMAQAVVEKSDEWSRQAARIEEIRLTAKRRITASEHADNIAITLMGTDWTL